MNNKDQLDQLTEESKLGQMGLQVINNHVFKEAFAERERQLFGSFCSTKHEDTETREEAWRTMQNLIALRRYFEQVLNTGKMADMKLNQPDNLN